MIQVGGLYRVLGPIRVEEYASRGLAISKYLCGWAPTSL